MDRDLRLHINLFRNIRTKFQALIHFNKDRERKREIRGEIELPSDRF